MLRQRCGACFVSVKNVASALTTHVAGALLYLLVCACAAHAPRPQRMPKVRGCVRVAVAAVSVRSIPYQAAFAEALACAEPRDFRPAALLSHTGQTPQCGAAASSHIGNAHAEGQRCGMPGERSR